MKSFTLLHVVGNKDEEQNETFDFKVLTHRFGLRLAGEILHATVCGLWCHRSSWLLEKKKKLTVKDPKTSGRTHQPAYATCWNSQLKIMKLVHTVSLPSSNAMSSIQELCKVLDSFSRLIAGRDCARLQQTFEVRHAVKNGKMKNSSLLHGWNRVLCLKDKTSSFL